MATEHIVSLFHDSFQRCQARSRFMEMFHERLFALNPEVKRKFEGVEPARQARALQASVNMVILASHAGVSAELYLKKVAERHSCLYLDIPPRLYDDWLQALLATVEECDSMFDAEIKQAWIEMTGDGLRYMAERYSKGPKTQSSKPDSTGT